MSKIGRPAVESMAINVRVHAEMVNRLDKARKNEPDLPNRPEMIRRIVDQWLTQNLKDNDDT